MALLKVGLGLVVATQTVAALETQGVDEQFKHFVQTFDKDYGTEYDARKAVFAANLAIIERENAAERGYTLAINKFADLTGAEFSGMYGGVSGKPNVTLLGAHSYSGAALSDSVDWVPKGAVTPVKNQAQCGSCWAFSSTGALEGAWQIATGKLVSFSEQQLVDCAKFRWGNAGCSGGLQPHAFNYIEQADLCTEAEYSYTGKNSIFTSCKASSCTSPGLKKGALTSYKMVDGNEQALMEAIMQQPVSVSIEADQDVFHLYKSGIVQGAGCGTTLDHAVLAVGYGTDSGKKYWKVKNSWTTAWGEQGYVRIIRGTDECGILNGPPVYPVVKAMVAKAESSIKVFFKTTMGPTVFSVTEAAMDGSHTIVPAYDSSASLTFDSDSVTRMMAKESGITVKETGKENPKGATCEFMTAGPITGDPTCNVMFSQINMYCKCQNFPRAASVVV